MALVVGWICVWSAGSSPAYGQEEDSRAALNGQAIAHANRGEYDAALKLLNEALAQGELNVTYLNLGRVHQKQGQCAQARQAFRKGLRAPPVPNPPEKVVQDALRSFIAELEQSCPGQVVVRCDPDGLAVTVDGQPHACGETFELNAGEHTFKGTFKGQTVTSTRSIAPIDLTEVRLSLADNNARLTVHCADSDAGLEVQIGDRPPQDCPAEVELAPGTYAVVVRRPGQQEPPWQSQVELGAGAEQRLQVPSLSDRQTDDDDDSVSAQERFRVALRYGAGFASLASGPLFDADDPDQATDQFPADGVQDELDGLQPGLLNHALELEGVAQFGNLGAGLLLWLQMPAIGFAIGPVGSFTVVQTDSVDVRLRAYGAYGQLLQRVRSNDTEFVAEVGPLVLGVGAEASVPIAAPLALVAGLHGQAGVPSLAVVGYGSVGAEIRF